jgi:hypothetical protein
VEILPIGRDTLMTNKKLTFQYLTEAHPTNAHENTNNKYVMENTL